MSRTILPVWLTTALLAVLIGVFAAPAGTVLLWLPLALAFVVLLTFAIQLILSRKEELVTRMVFSIGGAVVILLIATGVFALVPGSLVLV